MYLFLECEPLYLCCVPLFVNEQLAQYCTLGVFGRSPFGHLRISHSLLVVCPSLLLAIVRASHPRLCGRRDAKSAMSDAGVMPVVGVAGHGGMPGMPATSFSSNQEVSISVV